MAEKDEKKDVPSENKAKSGGGAAQGPARPVDDRQRFRYIGFEVFPGQPKDLFKSDQEKQSWVDRVLNRRKSGQTIREHNTLLEARITMGERVVLALASAILIFSLFVPWYSAYTVVEEQPATAAPEEPVAVADSLADSLNAMADTAALAATGEATTAEGGEGMTEEEGAQDFVEDFSAVGSEELITGQVSRKHVHKETESISWIGSVAGFGSISGKVFSSGIVLVLSGILMLVFMLLAVILPILNIYVLFGTGKRGDLLALHLKRMLRLNWLPLIIFVVVLVLSFFGANYGFDATAVYDSLSDSYGIGALVNTLSWGPFLVVAFSIMVAVKGSEI